MVTTIATMQSKLELNLVDKNKECWQAIFSVYGEILAQDIVLKSGFYTNTPKPFPVLTKTQWLSWQY